MLLALETSCDETSAAVVHDGAILANVVSSQIRLHAEYGGVVPELATREHLRHLLPVARAALQQAGVTPGELQAIAATRGPGLPAALRAGFTAAQSAALVLGIPCLGIHHHEAHLYSPWISGPPLRADFAAFQPNVSLIVSGGHTMLVHVRAELDHTVLGSTLDDAAGEAFDKVSKLVGLPYPGGPVLDRLAEEGRSDAYHFPRPMLHEPHDDFSFSGLKTSVRVFLQKQPGWAEDPQHLRDLCASVRAAIVETLIGKTLRAAARLGVGCITASGGVTCNRALRRDLARACQQAGLALRLAEPALCTDNAAMVGVLAERKFKRGLGISEIDAEPAPGWALTSV